MIYERMKYPHEQRDWVRYADAELQALIPATIKFQHEAAAMSKFLRDLTPAQYRPVYFTLAQEANERAVKALLRVLYYQGMRAANLP